MAITTTMARVVSRADDLKVYAKISARQLAVLVGLSPTVLGNGFAGVSYLGSEKEMELSETTILLLGLESAIRPLRLPEKIDDLRRLIDYLRDEKVETERIRESMKVLFGVRE
jgi:hypothetical protein